MKRFKSQNTLSGTPVTAASSCSRRPDQAWQHLERLDAASGTSWHDERLKAGLRSIVRISFMIFGDCSFDCFVLIRKLLDRRNDAALIAYSALNIWQSLKVAIAQAIRRLTPREIECLRLAFIGLTSRQTAERLDCKVRTVEVHLANAMSKLGASNRMAAIRQACRMGKL